MNKGVTQKSSLLICILWVVLSCQHSFGAQLQAKKKSDPVVYPDVWGLELPLPNEQYRYLGPTTVYENKIDGDIVVSDPIFHDGKQLVRFFFILFRKIAI